MSGTTGGRGADGVLRVYGPGAAPAGARPASSKPALKQPDEAAWANMSPGERMSVGLALDQARARGELPKARVYESPVDRARKGIAPTDAEWSGMGPGERLSVGVALDQHRGKR